MTARIRSIARKEFLHVRRDPRSLFLAIGQPLVLLLIFGFAITFDIRHVGVGIVDLDRTALGRDLAARIRATDAFDVRLETNDYARAGAFLDQGRVRLLVVIPRGFARGASGERALAPLQLLVDGSNNNTGLIAMGNMSRLIQDFTSEILLKRLGREKAALSRDMDARESAAETNPPSKPGTPAAAVPSIDARIRIWYNPELRSTNYIIPGLIAVIMMVMSAMLTSLTVAREWENGTMEQLLAGPFKARELAAGKLIPYFAIGMAQLTLILVLGVSVFGVPIRGNLAALFAIAAAFLLCGLNLGQLFSIITRSQQLAFVFSILLTMLPSFILSGFIFPISSMPKVIQAVTYLFPARYFLPPLRGIFLKGYGFAEIWPELVALAGFALLLFGACVRKLKGRLD